MKKSLLVLVVLLCSIPLRALEETIVVSGGSTETLPTTVSSGLQTLIDAYGMTLLGWTTSPITDGHRPATYYGLGATVTPASNTTYYAFFARPANPGELIVRQVTTPADGDTLLLASTAGSLCWLAPNTSTNNMLLYTASSYYRGQLLAVSDAVADYNAWIYITQPDNKFHLRSTKYMDDYYLNAISTAVKCSGSGNLNMTISSGYVYCTGANRYLYVTIDGSGNPYWKAQTAVPTGQSFAFYRKERYVEFATSLTSSPCPNCFIYIP